MNCFTEPVAKPPTRKIDWCFPQLKIWMFSNEAMLWLRWHVKLIHRFSGITLFKCFDGHDSELTPLSCNFFFWKYTQWISRFLFNKDPLVRNFFVNTFILDFGGITSLSNGLLNLLRHFFIEFLSFLVFGYKRTVYYTVVHVHKQKQFQSK
jgi:hypothetical protein